MMIGILMAILTGTLALSDSRSSLLAFVGQRPSSPRRHRGPFRFQSRRSRDWSSARRLPNELQSTAPMASTASSSGDIGTAATTATTTLPPTDFLGCTTESFDNYDVVKVDLENDRDYPIYIGTGYSDEQGTMPNASSVAAFAIQFPSRCLMHLTL
jgi:hypothetical protein